MQLAFEGDEAPFVLSEGYGVPVEGKACRTKPLNQCEKVLSKAGCCVSSCARSGVASLASG